MLPISEFRIPRFWKVLLVLAALVPVYAGWSAAHAAAPATAAASAETAPTDAAMGGATDQAAAKTEELPPVTDTFTINNTWMLVATFLVFIMHLGFATLECGLCRAKNTVNILTKNTAIPLIGILLYWLVGFNLMYPGWGTEGNLINWGHGLGLSHFLLDPPANGMTPGYNAGYTYWTDFLFQAMFAATCATIVSGAVAERIKFWPFLIFTVVFVGLCYPWLGSWKWGAGWLYQERIVDGAKGYFVGTTDLPGFYDFAGSTIVHSIGGWGALAGVILLGPRLGKYVNGRVNAIPGHSMPLATIGVFLLFLGWFGFNGGSVLSADPALVSLVFVTTSLAACAGGLAALVTSNITNGKPDLSMCLNGVLAGLVGITAGADQMSPGAAILIGLIAGVIVVLSVIAFDRVRLDDPVGALSVHLVCGIWGTLAVGLFGKLAGTQQLISQCIGIVAIGVTAFLFALTIFGILRVLGGIRVSEAEEIEGLDIGEHGMHAYDHLEEPAGTLASRPVVAARPAARPAVEVR